MCEGVVNEIVLNGNDGDGSWISGATDINILSE